MKQSAGFALNTKLSLLIKSIPGISPAGRTFLWSSKWHVSITAMYLRLSPEVTHIHTFTPCEQPFQGCSGYAAHLSVERHNPGAGEVFANLFSTVNLLAGLFSSEENMFQAGFLRSVCVVAGPYLITCSQI